MLFDLLLIQCNLGRIQFKIHVGWIELKIGQKEYNLSRFEFNLGENIST